VHNFIAYQQEQGMLQLWMNWRTLLALVAVAIVTVTIFYSRYLSGKIAAEERHKVEAWAEAQQFIARAGADQDISLATQIMAGQGSIPVIETNEFDSITNYHNLDSSRVASSPDYLARKLREFQSRNEPIVTYLSNDARSFNRYYYGDSLLLKQVTFYPLVQLLIVALFIVFTLMALSARHRSDQNQLWAGMAKETAHQLGTPLSALEGWVEMLKENPKDTAMLQEMGKDIERLKLVSDRFSKIGSQPRLEEHNLVDILQGAVDYMKKRAPSKVAFVLDAGGSNTVKAMVSPPLFEWVIENILKNALDAMEGKGMITVQLREGSKQVFIDITDTGKGIHASNLSQVFNAGFTTKKRGWGLGLTLSRRIIEQYHGGELYVRHSEPGKGTTFRISLKT
jgi:signal transduction histidine kinase